MLNPDRDSPQVADHDPRAPWMLDRKLGGMSPAARRKSWEASQRGAAQVVQADAVTVTPANGEHANGFDNDEPPNDGWQPPKEMPIDLGDAVAAGVAPAAITARPYQFLEPESLPRREWLYGWHLIRGFVSATVAPGGIGKSSLLIAELLSVLAHKPLLGARLAPRPLRVWYWNLEDPEDELQRRIQAACLHHELTAEDLGDRLHVNSRDNRLVIARATPGGALVAEPVVDALIAEIKAREIDVLVIDPFVSCHQAPENDNSAIDAVVKAWGRVADAGNCAIDLVDHTRKMAGAEVTSDAMRGASSKVDGCRDVRVLNRMSKEQAERWGIDNERLYFRVYSDKGNLAPPADRSDWYRLASVDLKNGPIGESDLVQAVERWKAPDAFDDVTVHDLFAVQKAIAADEWRADRQAKKWAGQAVIQVLELDGELPAVKKRVPQLLKVWLDSGALKCVSRSGKDRHQKKFIEVGEWATP